MDGTAPPREGREAGMKFGLTQEFFTASRDGGSDASFPGGNQFDGLPPAPMRVRPGKEQPR